MRFTILKRYAILLVVAGLTGSCLEQIDLEVEPEFQLNTVIQGKLVYGDTTNVIVRVSRLFDFTFNGRSSINVRYVRLFDNEGNSVEFERGDQVGDYQLKFPPGDPRMSFSADKTFYIEVATFEGDVFRSEPENPRPVPRASALVAAPIQVEFEGADGELRDQDYIEFRLTTPLDAPTEDVFLRWIPERTIRLTDSPETDFVPAEGTNKTCYLTESGAVRIIPTGSSIDFAGEIVNIPVYQEPVNFRFSEGYYMTIYQESLSRKAFTYWRNIGTLINRNGTIFEPPVGQVESNIFNTDESGIKPFGYFYATQQDTIRTYVSPEFAGNPDPYCPVPFPDMPSPGFVYCDTYPLCCNCSTQEGSRLEKPDFWVE